ncbi:hypothetical protein [Spiroplasma endosymbiont of Nebria brevicollis]|uniref:hypothetical protein n=1 Tax=Spiroplasma endosymbiont of Nebria brevicollis TaxID=3066284 RepID=UPI00313EF89A
MKSFQCEDFTMYYESDYDIIKIISLLSNQDLALTSEELALIALFDKRLKPIINNHIDSTISSNNSISKTLNSKPRILN